MADRIWNKIFHIPGCAIEFTVNVELYPDDEPDPTPSAPDPSQPSYYYTIGQNSAGVRFNGVGPGAIKLGSVYYTVNGWKVYDPTGTAQPDVFEQIASPT